MSEGLEAATTTEKKAKRTTSKPSATPDQNATPETTKKTIQVSFVDKDADLYEEIMKDAEDDERSASNFLLRFIRKNYQTR